MPYHLLVSFEWIIYKILCDIVALDLVLNEIFFTLKKQFLSKKIELETFFIKYILLKNNSVLLSSVEKILIVADLKVVKSEFYCWYLIFYLKNNGRFRAN